MKDVSLLTTPPSSSSYSWSLSFPVFLPAWLYIYSYCKIIKYHTGHCFVLLFLGVCIRNTPDIKVCKTCLSGKTHSFCICLMKTILVCSHLHKTRRIKLFRPPQSSDTQVDLYVLSVLLLIYSSPNFTEQESVADIEYGSIDHSPGCILSADWALRQMPSL